MNAWRTWKPLAFTSPMRTSASLNKRSSKTPRKMNIRAVTVHDAPQIAEMAGALPAEIMDAIVGTGGRKLKVAL